MSTQDPAMADQNNKFRHSHHSNQQQPDEQPGLEAAPSRYSTAPIPYSPPSEFQTPDFSGPDVISPGIQSQFTDPKWTQSQLHSVYNEPPLPPPPPPENEKRRVLGLAVPVFWGIIIAIVVVLAAAIAGGIAGGLAAQKSNSVSSSSSSSSTAPADSQTTAAAATPSTASGSSTSTATATTTSRATSRVSGLLPAPTDGGCPTINQTTFTPINAEGKAMAVGSDSTAQSFRQLCEVNYPGGAAYGNPDVYDILKSYVSTFEDCMTLCAAYNQAYNVNLGSGAVSGGDGGYCRSVAMIKTPGEYCYLKNGTGKSDTQGHPKDFISAVIISGL